MRSSRNCTSHHSTHYDLTGGLGAVWLINNDEFNYSTLRRIDPHTNRVTARHRLDSSAGGFAVGDGSIWVSMYYDNELERIDPARPCDGADRGRSAAAVRPPRVRLRMDVESPRTLGVARQPAHQPRDRHAARRRPAHVPQRSAGDDRRRPLSLRLLQQRPASVRANRPAHQSRHDLSRRRRLRRPRRHRRLGMVGQLHERDQAAPTRTGQRHDTTHDHAPERADAGRR